jgi:phosphoglycerate dehydrogenase-like enzyme
VAQLELMKKGSFIVVVSRGGIVDELALMKYLKLGHLGGAALDATVVEPLPIDSDLWSLDNIIITPHVSALSPDLYEMRRIIFEDNLTNYINNKNLNHICDKTASI